VPRDPSSDGDQVTADPDDGDTGHATAAYICHRSGALTRVRRQVPMLRCFDLFAQGFVEGEAPDVSAVETLEVLRPFLIVGPEPAASAARARPMAESGLLPWPCRLHGEPFSRRTRPASTLPAPAFDPGGRPPIPGLSELWPRT
jgi:hypothetical protein